MVEQFEVGKVYRCIATPKEIVEMACWDGTIRSGMKDGVARKCIKADWEGIMKNSGPVGLFEKIPTNNNSCWDFTNEGKYYEEVKEE
jgi:hypothetical protein